MLVGVARGATVRALPGEAMLKSASRELCRFLATFSSESQPAWQSGKPSVIQHSYPEVMKAANDVATTGAKVGLARIDSVTNENGHFQVDVRHGGELDGMTVRTGSSDQSSSVLGVQAIRHSIVHTAEYERGQASYLEAHVGKREVLEKHPDDITTIMNWVASQVLNPDDFSLMCINLTVLTYMINVDKSVEVPEGASLVPLHIDRPQAAAIFPNGPGSTLPAELIYTDGDIVTSSGVAVDPGRHEHWVRISEAMTEGSYWRTAISVGVKPFYAGI